MSPIVSIILCTRDRAESLRQTLISIGDIDVPADLPCELIIVDNASSDRTREVVNSAHPANMDVRYELEGRGGQSYARNHGLRCASGDFILFTDDDVRVPRNWVEGMCRPLQLGTADAIAGGVRIAPHLLRAWMDDRARGWLGSTDHLAAEAPAEVIGANFSFARRVLQKVPQFDTELGPGALGFGDDTLFARQLIAAGYRLSAVLDVCVEHHFGPSRLTRESFLGIAKRSGRTAGYLQHHWEHRRTAFPLLRAIKTRIQLQLMRLYYSNRMPKDGLPKWEADLLWKHYRWRQYLWERRRAPRYDDEGMRRACPDKSDKIISQSLSTAL